jgi:diguanylate cyclase (GGDEF)-like protein
VAAAVEAHLAGRTSHLECEYRLLHQDGSYRWMLTHGLAVRDEAGAAVRLAGSQADMTARKEAEEHLVHDALHDSLTGLPNRALFMDRLASTLTRAKRRADYPFAVLFLDLDRFKLVNDSLGHQAGDQLLVEIGRRLQRGLRDGDTVARLGGDEFAILLDDVGGAADAEAIVGRLMREVARPFEVSGEEVFTTASVGVALGSSDWEHADELLRDADTAMYRAKALGKARHVIFDATMRDRAVAQLSLETDLRRALERRELRLHFQPILSLGEEGRITGFEALVRWRHPSRGIVEPADFIPIAEETGLILPIGLWVIRNACRQLRFWQARYPSEPPLTMAVNLSARQCTQPELVRQVERILAETGIGPPTLRLEITEGTFLEKGDVTGGVLEGLRALGVQLCLDDFGTGYSSLSYLSRVPVASLKIDRSFVGRMGTAAEDLEIVRTIIALAEKLGMDVIAEGVETAEQLERIRSLNCKYAQGYLLSSPLDRAAVEALIEQRAADRAPPRLVPCPERSAGSPRG